MRYINFNGNIYPEHETLLPVTNRSYRYGDGFFESMVMFNKKVPLLDYHWSRLLFTAEVLSGFLPEDFTIEALEGMILDLASVNDAVQNARIRLQFYRKGNGLYLSDNDELGFSITMDAIENNRFEAGKGLKAGMRDDCFKGLSMVSDIKNSGAMMYVLAAQYVKAEGLDECILTNHFGQVCEGLSSNIFIVKGDRLITPTLDSGCVNGVMRNYIMWLLGDGIIECDIEAGELVDADEIIMTNAVKGVQWIKELNGKSYTGKKALQLTDMINKHLASPLV
jgi:branched-subunit amino acid aminotransferase/4-amino-4-deoxychorismate lyase